MNNSKRPIHFHLERWQQAVIWGLVLLALGHIFAAKYVVLDWPAVAILVTVVLYPFIPSLLPYISKFKVGPAEFELNRETEKLVESLESDARSTAATPIGAEPEVELEPSPSPSADVSELSLEAKILELAAHDKIAAIMRLGVEIERELALLVAMYGLRNKSRTKSVREAGQVLFENQVLSSSLLENISKFWRLRNQIAHSALRLEEADPALNRMVDSGITLLRQLRAIPRSISRVIEAKVPLYSDPEGLREIPGTTGVLLETVNAGTVRQMIFPAGRDFTNGEIVGWDWDLSRIAGRTYYRDRQSNLIKLAWSESAYFTGQNEDARFRPQ